MFLMGGGYLPDSTVDTGAIVDGTIASGDLADGSCLSEIADDDGAGSGLDADLLDGNNSSAFFPMPTLLIDEVTDTTGDDYSTATVNNCIGIHIFCCNHDGSGKDFCYLAVNNSADVWINLGTATDFNFNVTGSDHMELNKCGGTNCYSDDEDLWLYCLEL